MQTHKKLLLIVTVMLLLLMSAIVINVSLNFRDYSLKEALRRANATAEYVRDGLTSYMVNGIMDKREFFLDNIKSHKNIKDFWIIRSPKVSAQFGPGYKNEEARDSIDKDVIKSGKMRYLVSENADEVTLRVTIPYTASAYGSPNCLQCHNAKEGDVLGAISLKFDIKDTRDISLETIWKIVAINIIFLIVALLLINYFFKPIVRIFQEISQMIHYANSGDYSKRVTLTVKGEEQKIIDDLNNFFAKLEETFDSLKNSLSIFVHNSHISHQNPLEESKRIISELSNIYRFKKTIERDKTYEEIFKRIYYLLEKRFEIKNYKFYLVDKGKKERKLFHTFGNDSWCDCSGVDNDIELCRALRTKSVVDSTEFEEVCQFCQTKGDVEFVCLPFDINNEFALLILFSTNEEKEYEHIQENLIDIENYLQTAKPVLESRFLMQKLEESALKDGLTGLYNRRFLEQFIDKFAKQADRASVSYAVLMIDIDFFKMVNDTYGHDIGDVIIKELANVLKSNIRSSDMAIRYGGEEFLVLLYNPERSKVLDIAQNLADKFRNLEFQAGENSFKKTISIGIAYYPKQSDSIWQAIKFADTALYVAKKSGRDKVVEFDPDMYQNGEKY